MTIGAQEADGELARALGAHYSRRIESSTTDRALVDRGLASNNPQHNCAANLILGAAAFRSADLEAFVGHIGEAHRLYRQHPELGEMQLPSGANLLTYHALSLETEGYLNRTWDALAEAVILAAERDEVGSEIDILLHNLAVNEIYCSHPGRAARLVSYGRRIFVGPRMAALFALLEVQLAASEALFDTAIETGLRIRNLMTVKHAMYNTMLSRMLYDSYLRSGRFTEARAESERMQATPEPPNQWGEGWLMQAELAIPEGQLELAGRCLDEAERRVSPRFGRPIVDRCHLARAQLAAAQGLWSLACDFLDRIDLTTTREQVVDRALDLRLQAAREQGDVDLEVAWLQRVLGWRQGQPRVQRNRADLEADVDDAVDHIWAGRLRSTNEQRSTMLRLVDHDLRGLVATQQAALALLEAGQTELALEAISGTARSISDLSDVLAMVGSIDAGDLALSQETVFVADIVASVHQSFSPAARLKEQALVLDVDGLSDIALPTDSRLLGIVLSNLVSNALKYVDHGGRIELRGYVVGRPEEQTARIEVADDGPGLSHDDLTSIFGRYVTGSASVRSSESGLGLGLYLVAALSQVLGLRISAESPGLDLGSTFTVEIPLAGPDHPRASPA